MLFLKYLFVVTWVRVRGLILWLLLAVSTGVAFGGVVWSIINWPATTGAVAIVVVTIVYVVLVHERYRNEFGLELFRQMRGGMWYE